MRKIASISILILFLIGLMPAASAHHESPFPDVDGTHPNYVAIEYFRLRNVVSGYDDGRFHPIRRVNRAEFVSMVVLAQGLAPRQEQYKNCYSDVKKQWFADEVCYSKSRGWLVGFTKFFRPGRNISAIEAYRIVTRAFGVYNINAESNFTGSISRGDAAQMIYQVLQYATQIGRYVPGAVTVSPSGVSSPSSNVTVPTGYGTPYTPGGSTYTPPSSSGVSSNSYSCQLSGLSTSLPTHSAVNYSVNYCPLENTGGPSTQLLLGQAYLAVVWGEPLNFTITDKMRAMSLGYASEMFNMNPNYLSALAIKESKWNCSYYGGCFQITGGFPEVRNRFPLYFDSSDAEDVLVNGFGTAAVIASLYIRFGEALWDSMYQWKSFYPDAADPEVRTKIVSRGYNRGLWETVIRDIVQTERNRCKAAPDVFQCFPTGPSTSANGIALDHAQAIISYCRSLMQSNNFYDPSLTRQDVLDFIDQIMKPTFSQTSGVNWSAVTQRANDAFGCLQNSSGTISLRYDFRTLLQSLKQILPAVPAPTL